MCRECLKKVLKFQAEEVPPANVGKSVARQPMTVLGREEEGKVSAPARVGLAMIWVYRYSFSSFMGRGCRYLPTCSEYTATAIRRFGLWRGGWMGLARILRCNPWGASGYDPVPKEIPKAARWFMPWRYGQWTGRHIPEETRLDG